MKKVLLSIMALCLVAAITAAVFLATRPDGMLRVYFLDVGQGDAILVQQGSTQVLIDGGPSAEALMLELGRIMPFWDRYINLVISTHAHQDHLTGLVEVAKRFGIGQVLEPPLANAGGAEFSSALYDEWQRLIEVRKVPFLQAQAYQKIKLGDLVIDVLSPLADPDHGPAVEIDNHGVALRISSGDISFLLTADMDFSGEYEMLMERMVTGCTILKAGHHGSRTSTGLDLLNVVNPQVVIISVGENRFGHPHPELLARLEEVVEADNIYRTDRDGTLEFVTDGTDLWLNLASRN